MKDCVSCMHEHLSPMSDTCRECGIAMLNYEEAKPKPITNADRIRAMTDEELAHFMARVCPPGGKCNEDGNCFSCRLDWLKSPVEVDNGD